MKEKKISTKKYAIETIVKSNGFTAAAINDPLFVEKALNLKSICTAGNDKIGHTLNNSIAPIFTCTNCGDCSKGCYALKFYMKQGFETNEKRLKNKWLLNTVLAYNDLKKYFDLIKNDIKKAMPLFFRWHVSGDIFSTDYFRRMLETGKTSKNTLFLAMTKSYQLVNEVIKENGYTSYKEFKKHNKNLNLYFSKAYKDQDIANPYSVPTNYIINTNEELEQAKKDKNVFICGGDCNYCQFKKCGCFDPKQSKTIAFVNHN